MRLEKDADTWFIALIALRYCIGRRTYAPSLCSGWIKRHWSIIPPLNRALMRRDLGGEISRAGGIPNYLGDSCDAQVWNELYNWMLERPVTDYGGNA